MSSYVNVSAVGVVCAIIFHGCITAIGPIQPTRMSDTTYVIRYLNGVDFCDVTKQPACKSINVSEPQR